jgi:non-ribosomal peptide synthase protein (TIGR01720 family)
MVEERNGFEVAVIGMAGRFPGARDIEAFWRNLRGGVESISFFTDEEMLAAGIEAERLKIPNLVKAGGVLEDIELFDASFFGFSPREAELIDPQQRFFLECAWEALENAGYNPETYREAIGVYAGVSMSGYLLNIFSNPEVYQSADSLQLALGNDKDYLATRVAYKLNLRGPALTVQCACSTSLVAAHLACQNLIAGLCDIALAGGVTIFVPQKNGFIYQEGGIVAPDGHTRAFDAKAQGCMGGSGVGLVVLKRLEDALADGDTIHAVIKGGAVNNDGSVKVGYTAPSVEGQARVIRAAHSLSEVSPESITYIEAHGTATALGDPIEVAALKQAFHGATQKKNFCALGAVKTNVGHLDAAAGVTGLIKTVLALKHREIPPSLNFEEPNAQIDFANSPFYVNDTLREWRTEAGEARRAGVSSFGIGGTNAHLILEEAPQVEAPAETRPCQLLLLSARTETALEAATANLAAHLKGQAELQLADVAYTLQVGRQGFKHRRAALCRDIEEAVEVLETRDPQRFLTNNGEAQDAPVVFMFPGQGSQYVNMGLELYRTEPIFREQVDLCAELLRPHLGLDLRSVMCPTETETEQAALRLKQTLMTQTSLFVIEYALAKLWMAWGIQPQAMIGHSLGEYVAACLAGVFTLEDALRLVVTRGRLMQQLPSGSMLAAPLSEEELLPLLSGSTLSLAAINGPSLSVVSGPHEAVEKLARQLNAQGVDYRELHTSHAFHSEMMEPVLKPLAEQLSRLQLRPPSIPYISNVTGDWITNEEATDPQYWTTHLRRTVRFSDGLSTLFGSPKRAIMLELGPGDTLSTLARRHPLKADGQAFLTSLRRPHDGQSDVNSLLRAVGQLWLEGKQINWSKFYEQEERRRIPLPTYPFERKRYWVERQQLPEAGSQQRAASLLRKAEVADWFYAPVWKQSIAPLEYQDEAGAEPPSRWLIFEDECGLAGQLIARLEGEGHETVKVSRGANFIKTAERAFTIDPRNREHYDALFKEIQAEGAFPHKLLHLWNVTPEPEPFAGVALNEDLLEHGFYSLLFLAQALGEQALAATLGTGEIGESFSIFIISNNMQQVMGNERISPLKATLKGPCKVIPQEYPHVTCRSIDVQLAGLEGQPEPKLADQLLAELTAERLEQFVAYRGQQRWTQEFEPLRLRDRPERPARLRDRGVYLITGGLGGLGLEMAEYLARTVKARLVLIGRSAFPERAEWSEWLASHDEQDAVSQKIKRALSLEELGGEVLVLSADVADRVQLEAAIMAASRQFGGINGIIHAAGAAPSSLMQRKTREMAAAVLAPKVSATIALDSFVQQLKPDFFLLCSSLRALVGGPGMVDYSAANAFLDAYARSRPRDETTTISINWDGWAQAGMSLRVGALAISEAEQNDEGMSNAEGIAAFSRILRSSLPQVVVSTRDLQAAIEQEQSLTAESILGQLRQSRPAAVSAHPRPQLKNAYVAPRDAVEQALADIWQELLGIEGIGIHDNFFELGGDSLISIRIIARANQAKIHLTPKQVFERQTIAELAAAAGGVDTSLKAEQGLVTGPAPLTPIQHWFFEGYPDGPDHFNQAILLETRQRLDYDLLEQATRALLRHHDALRHRFKRSDSAWQQFSIAPDEQSSCSFIDLSSIAQDEQRAALEARATELQASLNLTEGPMMRVALFDLGPEQPGRLLIIIHHLVIDGLAWRILLEDLETAYHQLSAGESVRLPFKTTSYKQWAERLAQYAESGAAEKELDYWLAAPREEVSALPVDFPGGVNSIASQRIVSASLTEEETRALLQEVPSVYQTQINDALLTALAETFAKWAGNRSLLIDLEGHGRDPDVADVDLSRTLGWFTSIYPMLLATEPARDYGESLKSIKEQLRCIPQGGLGYGVLRYLGRDEAAEKLLALPQPEISFLYLGQMDQVLSGSSPFGPAAESGGPTRGLQTLRRYPLEVVGNVAGGRLTMAWTYSENLHRHETIEALAEGFINELRALIAHCLSTDEKGYTPSDFADFDWSQDDLDNIVSKISKSIGAN